MNIFITGGTGFIGTHTTKALAKQGHRLILLVRSAKEKKTFTLRNIRYVTGDISAVSRWKRALKKFKPDAFVHLAWEGIPDYGSDISAKNLISGLQVIQAAAEAGCKRIIVAGSCWEYGSQSGKLAEETLTQNHNAFSAAKNSLHAIGRIIAQEHHAEFIWTRFFYVYGPGQKPHSLIPSLLASRRRGEIPTLKSPDAAHDFVYVGDVARAVALLVRKGKSGIYNIGSGRLTLVARVANEVFGLKIARLPMRPKGFWADVSKLNRETGWKPWIGIREGIYKTIHEN